MLLCAWTLERAAWLVLGWHFYLFFSLGLPLSGMYLHFQLLKE